MNKKKRNILGMFKYDHTPMGSGKMWGGVDRNVISNFFLLLWVGKNLKLKEKNNVFFYILRVISLQI